MSKTGKINQIFTKPKVIYWQVIAGLKLSFIQRYDLILDTDQEKFIEKHIGKKISPEILPSYL